jgi:transcriptional regulator with XRE-family HTH domain
LAASDLRARQALTQRLRELRLATGDTGAQFAARLGEGWRQPKVSKIETGRQLPTAAEVQAWATATNTDPADLLDLVDRARIEYATFRERVGDVGGVDRLQDAIGAAEIAATRIAHYQPVLVPGILQTADYARELLHLRSGPAQSGASEEEINRMIASRLRRQAILYESSRDITLLMGEGALRTRIASSATMQAQREHIARLAETLTTATIGIVPFTAQAPIATLHGWSLIDDLATIETDTGNLEVADPEHVERYWHHTKLLLDVAATGNDAAALCRAINSEAATDTKPASSAKSKRRPA